MPESLSARSVSVPMREVIRRTSKNVRNGPPELRRAAQGEWQPPQQASCRSRRAVRTPIQEAAY